MNFSKIGKMLLKSMCLVDDIAYPRNCVFCGGTVESAHGYICWKCLAKLDFIRPPLCEICGRPVDGRIDSSFICSWCMRNPPAFDKARSACRYYSDIREMIHSYKYGGAVWLARDLADLVITAVRTHYLFLSVDAVTFVPLHFIKKRIRTYNQSLLIARYVAKALDKPLSVNFLKRRKTGLTQAGLTAAQRRENVKGMFQASSTCHTSGRNFLLIDDVMTTGATVNECAKVMKEAGAAKVYVATVAHG